MRIRIVTVFPEMFSGFLESPLIARAIEKGIAEIGIVDLKKYAKGSFRDIDDSPYGGGAGMILRFQPLYDCLKDLKTENTKVILLSASGVPYTQKKAREFSAEEDILLLAGHYEGVDARIEAFTDEILSVGDYILSGGEIPAMAVTDSLIRLLPGIIRESSTEEESYENGLLEYPQYTKPREYAGMSVPDVLLSGNHEKIRQWRQKQSEKRTAQMRPDLLEKYKNEAGE